MPHCGISLQILQRSTRWLPTFVASLVDRNRQQPHDRRGDLFAGDWDCGEVGFSALESRHAFAFAATSPFVVTTKLAARSKRAFHPEGWKKSMKKVLRNPRSSSRGTVGAGNSRWQLGCKLHGSNDLQCETPLGTTRRSAGIVCLQSQAKRGVERGMREAVGRKRGGGMRG
jgi:hypothetical protein